MMDFIQALIIGAAWCIGFSVVIRKVVFEEIIGYNIDDRWDEVIRPMKLLMKPVFACPACMASLHGSAIFFILLYPVTGILPWIPFCICLCGVNYFVTQFFVE